MSGLSLNNGAYLSYTDTGSGQPIVFLHGWSLSKEVFRQQSAVLSDRFRVVVPDLRGHGQSSPIDGQPFSALADDVVQLLSELELDNVVLVGWSMGAMLAWELVRSKAKNRITGLVTVDMVPRILSDGDWPYGLRNGKDASAFSNYVARMRIDWLSFTGEFIPRNTAEGKEAERRDIIGELLTLSRKNDAESMAQLWSAMANQDYRSTLQRLELPTLLIHGLRSQLYDQEAAVWMSNTIANSRRVGFSDSGHAPHLEEPDLFNQQVESFIEEITGQAGEHPKN